MMRLTQKRLEESQCDVAEMWFIAKNQQYNSNMKHTAVCDN